MNPIGAAALMVVAGGVFELCVRLLARVVTSSDPVRSSAVTEPPHD